MTPSSKTNSCEMILLIASPQRSPRRPGPGLRRRHCAAGRPGTRDLAEVIDAQRLARAKIAHLPAVHQERIAVGAAYDVPVAVDRACLAEGAAQRGEVGHAAGDPAE